eukprot:8592373-Ditylum_brightwellii.AAC.1
MLVQAAKKVRYWRTYKSDFLNISEASTHLHYRGTVLNLDFETLPLEKVCSNLTRAQKELKTAQQNAEALQDEYLEEMAQFQIMHNNTDIAPIIKNMHHHEEVKQLFNIMRPISKGQQGGAVSYDLAPDELESMTIYVDVFPGLAFKSAWIPIDDQDQSCTGLQLYQPSPCHHDVPTISSWLHSRSVADCYRHSARKGYW